MGSRSIYKHAFEVDLLSSVLLKENDPSQLKIRVLSSENTRPTSCLLCTKITVDHSLSSHNHFFLRMSNELW